jgi:hypothetical protein
VTELISPISGVKQFSVHLGLPVMSGLRG